jgi:C_GCAxxG_C_C family probable redox protein
MGLDTTAVPRIASGFGGGIGGSGATCGALVGAVIAVGLVAGRDSTDGDRAAAGAIGRRIHDAFREEMGSTVCRELTGLDLTTREGAQQLRGSDVGARVCGPAVELAERLALEELRSAAD